MAEELLVTALAGGQKLFNFLKRSIEAENNEIHRWIRTGQVRINKKRAKAFDIVHEGDWVRVPPFAVFSHSMPESRHKQKENPVLQGKKFPFPVVYENEHILVIDKPYGIACQGGMGQEQNIADMLKEFYRDADFVPAPAHRLDKETQGLLLIGKSYLGLRFLTDCMKGDETAIKEAVQKQPKKIYHAAVHGDLTEFAGKNPYLCHYLYHDEAEKKEKVYRSYSVKKVRDIEKILDMYGMVQRMEDNGKAFFALSTLRVLEVKNNQSPQSSQSLQSVQSLVEIGIYTGRKHQIRVQLSHSGFPLAGDRKYCPKKFCKNTDSFFLQAHKIILPENLFADQCVFQLTDKK